MQIADVKAVRARWRLGFLLLGALGVLAYTWHLGDGWIALAAGSALAVLAPVLSWLWEGGAARRAAQDLAGDASDEAQRQSAVAMGSAITAIVAGAIAISTYAAQDGTLKQFLVIGSGGTMIGGSALLVGAFLGFLFGIPRAPAADSSAPAVSLTTGSAAAEPEVRYRANTNLEQISDWFTKILVGVGLTQFSKIPGRLEALAVSLQPLLGGDESAGWFGVVLCLYFTVAGFMVGYLWTRLALGGAFRDADLAGMRERTARVEKKIRQLESQAEIDARALSLTNAILNPGDDTPEPKQEDLNQVLRAASQSVRVQVFYRASDLRYSNWANPATKPVMARTIPLFRALIACDPKGQFHRNHGQLGYALKDQVKPDWKAAEEELTRAIEIRGEENGWLYYEFNRAVCRIHLDHEYTTGKPSSPDAQAAILSDLRVAAASSKILQIIREDPAITNWFRLNQMKEKDLLEAKHLVKKAKDLG